MASLPPEDVLPILVADLEDEDAREVLDAAASAGGRVFVPLETAPVSAADHVLEVNVPGASEPIAYLATPLGPPTKEGFPLRISSIQKKQGAESGAHLRAAPPLPRPATRPSTREVVKSKRPSVRIETLSPAPISVSRRYLPRPKIRSRVVRSPAASSSSKASSDAAVSDRFIARGIAS